MATIQSETECPFCKKEAIENFNYRTQETDVVCMNCGYRYSNSIKRNLEGKVVDAEGNPTNDDSKIVYVEQELKNPYGMLKIEVGGAIGFGLVSIESLKHLTDVLHQLAEDNESEYKVLVLTRFVKGRKVTIDLLHND